MTWRGAGLLLAALAVVAAGAALPALVPLGSVLFVAGAGLVVVDGRVAPGRRALHAERLHDPILSVGARNPVQLSVRGAAGTRVRIREELPVGAHASASTWRMRLPASVPYTVTPAARGELHLGRTVVRAQGPLRLGWRQTALGEAEAVPVDADIAAVRVYDALARRGQLAELGLRTVRRRGEGTEFERVREAVQDDPLQLINWKATARTGRLMASELMPERAQPVIVCIDHGRLMGIGAGELVKLDHAINAALLLLHIALRSGDRAGALVFSDTVTARVAARAGSAQLRVILDALRPVRAVETEPDYAAAFTDFGRWQQRRALVVIFTDVADDEQGAALVAQCAQLRRRHLPLVVTVRDPDIDSIARRTPRTADELYGRAVAAGLLAERADVHAMLRARGIDVIDADVRALSPRVVNRYLELKRRGRL